jgi:hypothetical protein
MPNYCENEVIVSGDSKQVQKLLDWFEIETEDLDRNFEFKDLKKFFEAALPIPANLQENGGWFEWCIDNWGTKWDALDLRVGDLATENLRSSITFNYDTAWSPAIQFWQKMSEKFPDIDIENNYYEPGLGFAGTALIRGGVCEDRYINQLTSDDYKAAGAIIMADGNVDWDKSDLINIWDIMPISFDRWKDEA